VSGLDLNAKTSFFDSIESSLLKIINALKQIIFGALFGFDDFANNVNTGSTRML
jgi:hypothetical protein